jgi:hypothetical protein
MAAGTTAGAMSIPGSRRFTSRLEEWHDVDVAAQAVHLAFDFRSHFGEAAGDHAGEVVDLRLDVAVLHCPPV